MFVPIRIPAEIKYPSGTLGKSSSRVFDIQSNLHDTGFLWRPAEATAVTPLSATKGTVEFVTQAVKDNGLFLTYDVFKSGRGESPDFHWSCVYQPKTKTLLIQSPTNAKDLERESLMSVLEFAEELGCKSVTVAINSKVEGLNEMIRAFLYIGMKLVNPKVRQLKGHVLLETAL